MNLPTNSTVKIAGIALALSCLGGVLAGCGGSDSDGGGGGGSKSDAKAATVDGFCKQVASLTTTLAQSDPKDSAATVKGIQGWVADVEDYGTPSELSGEAREGFEALVGTFKDVEDDASFKDLQALVSGVSAADNEKMTKFGAWTAKNCTPASAPTDDAS